jgi:large subunit ribosomal protein L1
MSKRIINAKKLVDDTKKYTLDDGISILVKDYSEKFQAKFIETIEVVFKLGIDVKQSDQMVRGVIGLPHGFGKQKKILVIVEENAVEEAKKSNADFVGSDDFIEKIKGGFLEFDTCIATPKMMPKLAVLGKILGPKGLMPNPKLGTVSDNVVEAVNNIRKGQVEFRVDKGGIIHSGVASIDFSVKKVKENIAELYNAIVAAKPSKSKGVYIKRCFISSTHGPSLELDLKDFIV